MSVDPRTPCVVGVGRRTWRPDPGEPSLAPEPLAMWEEVARDAAADAGRPGLVAELDALHVVHCASWDYDDPPARLAGRLGAAPSHRETSILAGTSAQRMVNAAAERMLAGGSEVALVVGGEALATCRRLAAAGEAPRWSHPDPDPPAVPVDLDAWFWPTELSHGVVHPTLTFALFETARRADRGMLHADGQRECGALLDRLNAVAADNPHAWFPTRRDATELVTPTPSNRLVSSPYTKTMVAVMDVDMAAAILLTTHGRADELGIPREQRVYLRGWAFARDATHVAERPSLAESPAMRAASRAALDAAGLGVDDVSLFDLYSCFASSVLFASDALGLDPGDPRPLSLTGGLPYHGGPSSNYTAHAIAEAVVQLREAGDGAALISGVGMHMTKHVWAVYAPEPGSVRLADGAALQASIDATAGPLRPVKAEVSGPAEVVAWSVTHGRDADEHGCDPISALAVVELADGTRGYARTEDPAALDALSNGEWVGRTVEVEPTPGDRNLLRL